MDIDKQLEVFSCISFNEKAHTYLINNKPANRLSVTGLIKQFKKPFQTEEIANRVAKRIGVDAEELKKEWNINKIYACTLGTILHKYIEETYTKKPTKYKIPKELNENEKNKIKTNLPILIKHFKDFYKTNKHLKCIKSELILGDIFDTRICGTCDMLVYNELTKQLEILDFKTNKKFENSSRFANLLKPFDNLPECEEAEYTIQLNTYKYLIEKNTNLKIGGLKIIWFNASNPTWIEYNLKNIQDQIAQMFKYVKASF